MKKKIGIRTRVFLEVGAIIAVCLILLTVVNSRMLESVYMWRAERELKTMAINAESAGEDIAALLSEYESKKGVSIDLYDASDNYIYEGGVSFISGAKLNVVSRSDEPDGSYFNILTEEGSTTQYILYGRDFENGCHIEIISQKDPIQENASLATSVTTVISIAALLFSLVFISLYAKRFTKPLIQMSDVTARMSKLDFSQKCEVERKDEIGELAASINTLSTSLDTALTELKETNEHLVEDIEKERRLEQMRKDFTSSASHELKTPIAIIRGYAEAMKMSLPEGSGELEYCDIIMNEADKMNSLVLNLLEMSLYSSGVNKPRKQPFSINDFIQVFMKKTAPIFTEKGISASAHCDGDFTGFGDIKQLDTVLTNLISNACSHALGEKIIRVSVSDIGEFFRISVYNSGSFVADKDKDLIFNSFYRADKAHSRAEGRFGLGLSIVKSITELHGTECGFNNEADGVTFWFNVEKPAQNEAEREEI